MIDIIENFLHFRNILFKFQIFFMKLSSLLTNGNNTLNKIESNAFRQFVILSTTIIFVNVALFV